MSFFDKYTQHRGRFLSDRDMINDSYNRFNGNHKEQLTRYNCNNRELVPGLVYTFKYGNVGDINDVIHNKKLYYDSNPLVLTMLDEKNNINHGLNLNVIPHTDRLKLFNILHNNIKIHEINGGKNPTSCKPYMFQKSMINNILKINNIPYIKIDRQYVKDLEALDYSDILHISNLFFDSVKYADKVNMQILHNKIKNIK